MERSAPPQVLFAAFALLLGACGMTPLVFPPASPASPRATAGAAADVTVALSGDPPLGDDEAGPTDGGVANGGHHHGH